MKRPDGITILSVYHFVVAAVLVLCLLILLALVAIVLVDQGAAVVVPIAVLALVSMPVFLIAAANVVAGWALLRMLEWGRWLAIALGALALPVFPVGTLIGGAAIWYLLQPGVKDTFLGALPTEED
jgi:hypothetical protein